ncbi:MAG: PEGA domain-containing protein, partial [Candidatus Scalindua sp.]|nr:PEGA domain-containing protein [Candidatus Scalindua sp.]
MIISRLTYYFIFLIALSQLAFAQLPIMQIVGNAQKVNNEIVSRRDTNGRFCAAIQIKSSIDGLAFSSYSGIVGDIDHKPGRDMVYLQPDERVLEVYATGYEPFKIILSEYGIHLKPKEIWEIIVTGDKINDEIPINIIVKPDGASITIDHEPSSTGRQFSVVEGDHKLIIEKSGYQSLKETIKVDLTNTYFEYTLEEVEDVDFEIRTQPSDANVYIDDLSFGLSPISSFFPIGTYSIRIEKPEYVSYFGEITIASPKTEKSYLLEENFGSITISSSPKTGMEIYIDGNNQNKITPNAFQRMKPGIYKIKALLSNFDAKAQIIELKKGEDIEVNLTSEWNYGNITVNSSPKSGLSITIDGKEKHQTTPYTFEYLKPGEYKIQAKSEYYLTDIQTVDLNRGDEQNIDLISKENFALLTIKTHELAKVYINDNIQNNLKELRFSPQLLTIKVTLNKAPDIIETVILKKGDKRSIELIPEIARGDIQITVNPYDAQVELTGDADEHYTFTGKKVFKNLPVGDYELQVTKFGFEVHTETLTLILGEKIKRNIQLEKQIISQVNNTSSDTFAEMVFVKGGTFEMGCGSWTSDCSNDEKPVHTVTVDDFYIGKYEVTQKQWKEIMGSNPSHFIGENLPVESVSWNDVQDF